MTSTFFGLETARRALMAQQSALHVTGHNISNANTPGYTRQTVNFQTTLPYPPTGLNSPKMPGQLGTGVSVGDITRIRDSFTDMQYRTENSKLGYWQSKADMVSQMENIMNEPSDTGLSKMMDEFWNSLQDLAVQPQNDGARRVVRERGISLANTFNYISNSLKTVQKDYRQEIDTTQDRMNSILRQINSINKQIGSIEPHGYLPNDLYDERDRLVDELSNYVNIKVDAKTSGGLSSANAEGKLDIYLATPQGDVLKDSSGQPIKLVDAAKGTATGIHIQYENRSEQDSPVTQIKFFQLNENQNGFVGLESNTAADDSVEYSYLLEDMSAFNSQGALKGFIEGYGYKDGDEVKGTFNDMLTDLDQMAYTFATHFNLVHSSGWSLNEIQSGVQNSDFGDFFNLGSTAKGAASLISVASHIIDDVQNIAAAAEGNVTAGAMSRAQVDTSTVGNPSYTGIYNPSDLPDDYSGTWPTTDEISVSVEFDGENWNYTFSGVGSDEVATYSTTERKAKLLGIDFDTTTVSKMEVGDTWTFTLNTEGEKSSDEAFVGNGSNALALADVKDAIINYGGTLTNVQSFYQGMIGKLGDNASEAYRMTNTSTTLKDAVDQRRMSESSVSLDEEMVNMIKFQQAYNAAARNITLVDEILDKIVNGLGLGGR